MMFSPCPRYKGAGDTTGRGGGTTRLKGEMHVCDRQDSPVIIEDDSTGYRYPALLRAGKGCELYLESNYALRPGSTLHLQFPAPLTDRRAVIRWRKRVRRSDSSWSYALGIRFDEV